MSFSLIGSLSSLIVTILQTVGLPGLFALMAVESFGIPPLPSEIILPFTGFLVVDGTFDFAGAATVAIAGGLVGAFAAYAVGRWWRHRITGMGLGRLRLEPRHLDRVDRYFAEHGEATVGLCRLVPVLRAYVSYPAGTAEMSPVRFGVYSTLGSAPYAVALIYAGTVLRSNWRAVSSFFVYLDYPLIGLIAAIVLILALQVTGVVPPGWPFRRAARAEPTISATNGKSPPTAP